MPLVRCGQIILFEKALHKHIIEIDFNKREGEEG
jgi:hypothetical protein